MAARKQHSILALFLIIVLCVNLLNVQTVRAEGEPPTEPPAPTQVETEPPTELPTELPTESATEIPVEETPAPVTATSIPEEAPLEPIETEETTTSVAEILEKVPDDTEVIVLDESGDPLPLVSEAAAEAVETFDPMWCPAGVLPGIGNGCSQNFPTVSALLNSMSDNPSLYDQDGIIYFMQTTGSQTADSSFTLTNSSLGGNDFNILNDFNLTLQGGWNGQNGSSATFTGQTNFGSNVIQIGTSGNPWIGNLTLNNFSFNGTFNGNGNQAPVMVYTTTGNITLSNVDVTEQRNEEFTGILQSTSGNIVVQNGSTFDGDNTNGDQSQGFTATTGGSITISDTTFSDANDDSTGATHDGATLSAPIVTLSNVTATGNDGSGVLINGNSGSNVFINGGTFSNNQEYGIQVGNTNNTTIYVQSEPTCTNNVLGCSNDTLIVDTTAPVITPTVTGTAGANGWYTSDVTVSWTVSDPESNIKTSTGCTTSSLTAETSGQPLTCSATNNANLSNSVTVTVKIDKTAPTSVQLSLQGTQGSNGWYTADVTARTTGTDALSGVTCTPDQTLSAETAGLTVNGSCTNGAGMTTNASPLSLKLDKTAPAVTLSVTAGNAGTNGWYTSNVTIHTEGTETVSGPINCTGDQFQTTETTGTNFSGSCTNAAGLTGNASLSIKLDKTNPTITFTDRTAPNANGWNHTNVTLQWTCSDSFSGPVTDVVSQTVTTEGAGQSVTGTCTDQAGNTASDTQGGINIDKTAPSLHLPSDITAEATSTAGVTVTYSASVTDNLDQGVVVGCAPASGSSFSLGATKVNCSSTDAAGNTANGGFLVQVGDSIGPVIAFHADVTEQATGLDGATVNYTTPTATDAVDGPVEVDCSPVSGLTFPIGATTITCHAIDSQENSTESTFTIHVVDTTGPVISSHPDMTVEATSSSGALADYTVPTATDVVDGSVEVSCSPASGQTFPMGDSTVTCAATDQHENTSTSSFVVHVVDTTAPVIASHPDVTVEATFPAGAVVNYTNPTASDIVDQLVTVTCSPASGTMFSVGDTTVACNAMDSHENVATPVTFTVHVVDTTAPVLNLPATITTYATGPQGALVTFSASASDLVDGAVPVLCSPASGSAFPVGTNTVNCLATDSHGNRSTGNFIINVQDPEAPILNLPEDIIAEATGPSGAAVNFSVSATDVVDGSTLVICSKNSGSTFDFGVTTVTCSSTDSSGHTNTASFLVTVRDTTAPAIAPHADVNVNTDSATGANVNYTSPATSDAVDGEGIATCSPASESLFAIGDTTVTCTATDAHGNTASTTFVVQVGLNQPASSGQSSTSSSSFLIPLTGGELIDLNCNSILWVFGIKVSFLNLCDYQTTINSVEPSDLPAELPNGTSFVMGLHVDLLQEGTLIEDLPIGSGIELDFPIYNALRNQFVVLFWNDVDGDGKGEWIEISELLSQEKLSEALNSQDGLYQLDAGSAMDLYYQVLTTQKPGVFVLVKRD